MFSPQYRRKESRKGEKRVEKLYNIRTEEKMESYNVEYKSKYNAKSENILKSIVAFLNTNGGKLYIGINDDGSICGIKDNEYDETKLNIIQRIREHVCFYSANEIKYIDESYEHKKVICIKVDSGAHKPYYLRKYGLSPRGVYTRENAFNIQMTELEINNLLQSKIEVDLTNQVAMHQYLTITHLSDRLPFEITEMKLYNMGLYTNDGKKSKLYELLADENNTSIKYSKYAGSTRENLIENIDFGEVPIYESIEAIMQKINDENRKISTIDGLLRNEVSRFNIPAIRELVVNSFAHNDYYQGYPKIYMYNDHLEITSQGGLTTGINKALMLAGKSISRNPALTKILEKLYMVENVGSGLERVLSVYDSSIFTETEGIFKVELPFLDQLVTQDINTKTHSYNKSQRKILAVLDENIWSSIEDIANNSGVSSKTIYKYIGQLVDDNIVVKSRSSGRNIYKLF